jgi:hypothetical protein
MSIIPIAKKTKIYYQFCKFSGDCLLQVDPLPHPKADFDKTFWFAPPKPEKKAVCVFKENADRQKNLATFVKDLMREVGFVGQFTNHSLKTTTVNRMIDSEIMNRTGHRC